MVTSEMDVLSFCDGFNNHHIGTLLCRQEGHPRHQKSRYERCAKIFLPAATDKFWH
jgi:hypothetical protein